MTIWMKVTDDKYELPVMVAESQMELASMLGISPNTIASSMSHHRATGGYTPYRRIEIEEGEEND